MSHDRRLDAVGLGRRPGARMLGTRNSSAALTLPTTDLLAAWDARVGVTDAGAGRVSSWVDYHGSYDAVQATGADQPLLVAAALGGQDVVRFNAAATESMEVASLAHASTSQTVYVVCTVPSISSTDIFWHSLGAPLYVANRTLHLRLNDGSNRILGTQFTGTHVSCVVLDGGAPRATHYLDGAADGAGVVYTPRALSGAFRIGSLSFPANMDIAALFIYTAAHDATARAGVEAYITQEWGV